jgi:hypothetical protein
MREIMLGELKDLTRAESWVLGAGS